MHCLSSVNCTALDSIAASFHTALLVPSVRAVYPDKVDAVYDGLEEKGGIIIGRNKGDWLAELRNWMKTD